MPDKKLLGAIAFAAALAGGGVAGALLATPSLSAAQEADDGTTTTTEDGTTDDNSTDDSGCVGGIGHAASLGTAAEAIGITEDELRTALGAGESIASVAEANDIDVQSVIDAMVADATAQIDEAVAAGDLTAEEGEERKADLVEKITEVVNREGLPARGPGGRGHHGPPPDDTTEDGASEDDAEGS